MIPPIVVTPAPVTSLWERSPVLRALRRVFIRPVLYLTREVPGPERVVEVIKEVPGPVRVEYVERPVPGPVQIRTLELQVPGPVRVEYVERPVPGPERVVEVVREVLGPERLVPGPERVVSTITDLPRDQQAALDIIAALDGYFSGGGKIEQDLGLVVDRVWASLPEQVRGEDTPQNRVEFAACLQSFIVAHHRLREWMA